MRKKLILGIAAGLAIAVSLTIALANFGGGVFNRAGKELVVVTHDSAVFSEELLAKFKADTGITVTQLKAGDTGSMVNKLILTKDEPIGDLVYGVDNTFESLAVGAGIFDDYGFETDSPLHEINFGDVCFNYDKAWFAERSITPPSSIDQLVQPQYRGLTVVTNPNTSSPGLALLAATISKFGEAGSQTWWQQMKANGVKVSGGWEDAYFTDFSGSSGAGNYPIVLSYSSSPAFEIRETGESGTASILDGCFRQYESAAILKGTKNKAGAWQFIKFMQSVEFQETLPETMYVYPVVMGVALPTDWAKWATVAPNPVGGELDIAANREKWLAQWSEIFG